MVFQEFKTPVKPGEVMVLGTDGLFDNLYATQIKEIIKLISDSETGGEPERQHGQ